MRLLVFDILVGKIVIPPAQSIVHPSVGLRFKGPRRITADNKNRGITRNDVRHSNTAPVKFYCFTPPGEENSYCPVVSDLLCYGELAVQGKTGSLALNMAAPGGHRLVV